MSADACDLVDAELHENSRRVLGPIGWSIPRAETTALLGPSGTGKSALLAALADELPSGLARHGRWACRLPVVRVAQRRRSSVSAWRAPPLANGEHIILLDEPPSGSDEDRAVTEGWIGDARRHGHTVVLVTHDLRLAKSVADHVALLVAGRLIESGNAGEFFGAPRSELTARFLRQGNCWPHEPAPTLPDHFQWVIGRELAGMGRPGLLRAEEDDLTAIAMAGVRVVVSLTRRAIGSDLLRSFGLRGRHFPIEDMGVPALGPTARLCAEITRSMELAEPVVVHCHAGMGRTGTILAAILVWQGRAPADAISCIRRLRPGYVQTKAQLEFVGRFADYA